MARRSYNFLRAVLTSILGTGLSRVLGAVRDMVIAAVLGAGASSDAFWIAFTVPSVFRRFVADEGLTGALVPAVAQAEEAEGIEGARRLANSILTALLLANLVLCVVGVLGAEWLVYAFAAKFADDPEKFALTVTMTRWLFPFVSMVSLVSYAEALLNYRGHFFVPKIAPGLVSAGIAICALLFASSFTDPAYALVMGVLVGGIVHVLVNVPPLLRVWGRVGLSVAWGDPRFRRAAWEMGKVIAIGVLAQLQILLLRQLAAMVGEGAVTRYWYAARLVDLAQGVIAVAVGSALLPTLSEAVSRRDWQGVRSDVARAFRLTAFVLLPVTAVLLCFAEPITALLFRRGAYTAADVRETATTLQLLIPFMLGLAGINLIKKLYFAREDRTPLFAIGGMGVCMTLTFGSALIIPFGIQGLAAALSISTVIQFVAYVARLHWHAPETTDWGVLGGPLLRMGLSSLPVALILGGAAQLGDWSVGSSPTNLGIVALSLAGSVLAYLVCAWLLGVEELTRVVERLSARFRR